MGSEMCIRDRLQRPINKLCVGQRAELESAIHGLREVFNSSSDRCLLQIAANNACNRLNRFLDHQNIHLVCPSLRTLLVNLYRQESILPIFGYLMFCGECLREGDNGNLHVWFELSTFCRSNRLETEIIFLRAY